MKILSLVKGIKKMQAALILFSSVLLINNATAQLSGSYTIGGISPNYTTLDAAINDLCNQGVSGPVVFNLRPGTYIDSVTGCEFFGSSPSSVVTFQAENLDSSSVIITVPRNSSNLFNAINRCYFQLNELTFYENDSNFYAIWMENLGISNCIIYAPYTAGIEVDYGTASIKNSVITCGTTIDYIFSTPTVVTGNTFTGQISFGYDTCNIFRHNTVNTGYGYMTEFDFGTWDSIEYNQFNGQCSIGYPYRAVVTDNSFSCSADSGTAFNISYTYYPKITNNTVHGNVEAIFLVTPVFTGNKLYDGSTLLDGYHALISNNYIKQSFAASGDTDQIYGNNFSSPGYLNLYGNYCSVKNNNFPGNVLTYYSGDTLTHNNYFPVASLNDLFQTNYDPQYPDSINIHTQNLQLIGKGVNLAQVKYDIDGILRNNPPTIGANELCIPANDTVNLACGDSVNLFMCNAPNAGNFIWSPAAGLSNAFVAAPSASPSVSTMFHVLETISRFTDSVYVKVVPYKVKAYQDTIIPSGDSTMLLATYNAGAAYQWLPLAGLSSPNSNRTQAKPMYSTTYTVTASVPGCGITVDSVRVKLGCPNNYNEPICIVTIDTATSKCKIIWGRTNSPPDSGSYNIYKDTASGYKLTHSQSLNVLSEFIDPYSTPSVRPQSYKLSTVDSCAESALSSPHTSIYLTTSSAPNVYILNWTAYVGFTPSKYRIFRGPSINSVVQIDSVPSSVLTYRDTLPPIGSIYLVEAVNPYVTCVATTGVLHHNLFSESPLAGSLSNGFDTKVLGMQSPGATVSNLTIYPNPGKGYVNLSYSMNESSNVCLSVMDELGQIVYDNTQGKSAGVFNEHLNLEYLASGIYSLRLQTNGGIEVRKLVILH